MKHLVLAMTLFVVMASSVAPNAWAADAKKKAAAVAPESQGTRSKDIQFDDSVVEGMNKGSKDSLEMTSKNEDPNRGHLYHRRIDFKPELRQLTSEVGSE